jgi:hypothetical protein
MRAVADPGLVDRLAVEVDPDADPVDWDQALAVFLLAYIRQQAAGAAEAGADRNITSAAEKQYP